MTRTATATRPAPSRTTGTARPCADPVARMLVADVKPLQAADLAAARQLVDPTAPAAPTAPAPRPARQTAQRPSAARLTRRGRLVITGVALLLLLVATSIGRISLGAATDSEAPLQTRQITVHEGDTLWTIAARVAPQADRREAIEQLRRLNDLSGSGLVAGQALTVPA